MTIPSGEYRDGPVKVSVCIPTYNGQEYITEAVASVLAQTYADFELLVVDDDSTDATRDLVRSFADPRLRLHHNTRRHGLPGNWNRCLELARGDYVCVFHQDDLMLPENLAHKVRALDADPAVTLVHSAAEVLAAADAPTPTPSWDGPADEILEGPACLRRLVLEGNFICCPSVVVRRRPLVETGGFYEKLGFACDYDAWMRLAAQGRVAFLARPLVRYRWHGKNASHAFAHERAHGETSTACRRALEYYAEHTGRREEAETLAAAWATLSECRGQVRTLQSWVGELEKARDWLENTRTLDLAELQRCRDFIEEQKKMITYRDQRLAAYQEALAEEQRARNALLASGTWKAGSLILAPSRALRRAAAATKQFLRRAS